MRIAPSIRYLLAASALLAAPLLGPTALAQPGPPPELQKAQALIQAKDFDGAIALLEDFAAKNPKRPRALTLLASAYEQKGDLEKASAAYTKLGETPAQRAQAWYGLATVNARRKANDEAFKYLRLVRGTGSWDMDQLLTNDHLAELRKDARFPALMPKPVDFEKPFVENVKVLREIRGGSKGSQFGWIARRIGDVDRDGAQDFTTSAPTYTVEGTPAGRVYVYSGKTGALLWMKTGAKNEQLGIGLHAAGDVNADGVPDVVAGAPGSGFAYVFSGKDGAEILKLGTGDPKETFGAHTATAGDLDADGHADLAIGAPGASGGAGRAYVYSGKSGALLQTLSGDSPGDGFGSTVGGSLNGKSPLLLVGAPGAGPKKAGRVYAYTGLTGKPKWTFEADETGSALGAMFISIVGDTDKDGAEDVYASDFPNTAKGASTGRAYVYSGATGKVLLTLTGEKAGDGFGIGVADAGDLDGDGHADLVVGAWQSASAAPSGGKVTLHSGKDGRILKAITCRIPGDTFGFDTTNLGDVDGDGTIDLLLTSAWSGVDGFQSGRVFVVSSGIRGSKVR